MNLLCLCLFSFPKASLSISSSNAVQYINSWKKEFKCRISEIKESQKSQFESLKPTSMLQNVKMLRYGNDGADLFSIQPCFFSFLSTRSWFKRSFSLLNSLSFLFISWLYWLARFAIMFWSFCTWQGKIKHVFTVYTVKLIQLRQFRIHPTLSGAVITKKVPLLFHFSGSFANSSLSAAASALSQGVQCFLFWTSQVAPMITE